MNNRRLSLADERIERQAVAVDSDVERVRMHVARIRLQIKELERRTRRTFSVAPAVPAR